MLLRKSTNEISIRPKWSKDKKIAVMGLSIVTVIGILFGAFKLGYRKANFDSVEHGGYITRLEKELSSSQSAVKELRRKLAVAERDAQVQQSAYAEINKTYQKIDSKNEELNRKLSFYRSIVSPEDGRGGIKIHDVRTTLNEENQLEFEVVMIQSIDHSVSRKVSILVELLASKSASSPLQQWPADGRKHISLRYSDSIKGVFDDVQAASGNVLRITARPDNEEDQQLVEWHKL